MKSEEKIYASAIIIFTLWMQASANISFSLPKIPVNRNSPKPWDQLVTQLNLAEGRITKLGELLALRYRWRMFTPVARSKWWLKIRAIHPNGQDALLPLPRQVYRTWWEHNLVDAREAKFHYGLRGSRQLQASYAQYLCASNMRRDYPISAIRLDLYWQNILPPTKARSSGHYLGAMQQKVGHGQFKCANSSGS